MLRVLAGDLSAPFNLDGLHLHRYVDKKYDKVEKICEQLILHNQVLVPTNDFLTAVGLLEILGEDRFIDLLEAHQLRFIRMRQVFGYVRGSGRDGSLAVFGDPAQLRPQDSPIDSSIAAGLSNCRIELKNRSKISRLLADSSAQLESAQVIDSIREQTYADFRKSKFWNSAYSYHRTLGLRLPGVNKLGVRVLGPETDVIGNPIDALLTLTQVNIEGYLAHHFDCISTSTTAPVGDSVALKLTGNKNLGVRSHEDLWTFLRLEGIHDLAAVTCTEPAKFSDLLRLTRGQNCEVFRTWFANNRDLSQMELAARYIELLHDVPWVSRSPMKAVRFLVTWGIGKWAESKGLVGLDNLVGLGEAAGIFDTFFGDKVQRKSPKFFVADLKAFQGRIGLRSAR